jgi:hypothetical protein
MGHFVVIKLGREPTERGASPPRYHLSPHQGYVESPDGAA